MPAHTFDLPASVPHFYCPCGHTWMREEEEGRNRGVLGPDADGYMRCYCGQTRFRWVEPQ